MTSIKKVIGFGLLTWLIPFIVSFAFYSPEGEVWLDIFLFKSIMIVLATLIGALFLVKYFKGVTAEYVKEGIIIGLLWLVLNLILDLVILVPMSGMMFGEYVAQIGLRYLMIPIMSIAFGMVAANAKNKQLNKL